MKGPLASAKNVLLQEAPAYGPWRATTTIDAADLTRFGAPGAGIEAGIIVWEAENPNKFSKFVLSRGSFSDPTFVVKHEHTVNNASTLQADRDVSRPTDVISPRSRSASPSPRSTARPTASTHSTAARAGERIGNRTSAGDFDGPVRIGLRQPPPDRPDGAGFPGQPIAHFERLRRRSDRLRRARRRRLRSSRAQPPADGSYTGPVNVDAVGHRSGGRPVRRRAARRTWSQASGTNGTKAT